MNRPPWLLAFVVGVTLLAIITVILGGHEDNVGEILEVMLPVLAALVVVDHVNRRSDEQDAKLQENHEAIKQIDVAINGPLTVRLEEAAQPGLDEQQRVRAEKAEDDDARA